MVLEERASFGSKRIEPAVAGVPAEAGLQAAGAAARERSSPLPTKEAGEEIPAFDNAAKSCADFFTTFQYRRA
jgi:hypothetical protein